MADFSSGKLPWAMHESANPVEYHEGNLGKVFDTAEATAEGEWSECLSLYEVKWLLERLGVDDTTVSDDGAQEGMTSQAATALRLTVEHVSAFGSVEDPQLAAEAYEGMREAGEDVAKFELKQLLDHKPRTVDEMMHLVPSLHRFEGKPVLDNILDIITREMQYI